jgi:hypothetical protein
MKDLITREYSDYVAPFEYWIASDLEKSYICNGCGTRGWKGKLVPETIWGLNISEACNIHDWMYHFGDITNLDVSNSKVKYLDKIRADNVFLANMYRAINNGTKWRWLRRLRRNRAKIYYNSVVKFGKEAFERGKLERLGSLAEAITSRA